MTSEKDRNENAWVTKGREVGATHVLDVCDTFDYTHYPVYVMPEQDVNEVKSKYDGESMQSVYYTYEVI